MAKKAGRKLQKTILDGSGEDKLHLYMNYHNGEETTEELYGHDKARLQRLRALKRQYDPKKKFSFYAPID